MGLNEGDLRDAVMEFWEFVQSTIKPFFPYQSYYFYITILPLCYFMGVFGFILNYKFI